MKIQVISFTDKAWSDFESYQDSNQSKLIKKIGELIKAIRRDPYKGIGKPEALKHNRAGFYSRRITDEHRLVYEIVDDELMIISCKFHYE
jgi:toxin YoeB